MDYGGNRTGFLPLDEVREQLRDHIRMEKAEQAVNDEIARLRAAADIQILVPLEARSEDKRSYPR